MCVCCHSIIGTPYVFMVQPDQNVEIFGLSPRTEYTYQKHAAHLCSIVSPSLVTQRPKAKAYEGYSQFSLPEVD